MFISVKNLVLLISLQKIITLCLEIGFLIPTTPAIGDYCRKNLSWAKLQLSENQKTHILESSGGIVS